MNDRLAELQSDISVLTQEDGRLPEDVCGDIEVGRTIAESRNNTGGSGGSRPRRSPRWRINTKGRSSTIKANNSGQAPSPPGHMEQFFDNVETVKSNIAAIADATERIGVLKDRAILALGTKEERGVSGALQRLVDDTNGRAKNCKKLLSLLKEETVRFKKAGNADPADLRVRDNLVNTLLRKFLDEVKLYQNAHDQYKNDMKKKATRQIQMFMPEATDEEIDRVMRSEGGREALYQQQILTGGVNDKIETQHRIVADRYQDLVTIEASVAELHKMFLDFALLTEEQGDTLDQIEYQVQSAAEHTDPAVEDLQEAVKHQRELRKKHCRVIFIVVALIIIVVIGQEWFDENSKESNN